MKKTAINDNKTKNQSWYARFIVVRTPFKKNLERDKARELTFALYCESNISDDVTTLLTMQQ